MLWSTSPETETIDGIEYRNVWLKDDPVVARDALALGARVTPPNRKLPANYWSRNLCVVAYGDKELIATATSELRFAQRVRANMAFLRVYVSPPHRERGLVIPLTFKFHEIMRKHSLDNPDKRIGGVMAVVTAPGMMDEPVTKGFHVLIGYNTRSQPLIVRWFEHYRL